MTKLETVNLFRSLNQLGDLKGVKFAYGVSKNLDNLKSEMELLDKTQIPSEKFKEFDKARLILIKEYVKKDEKGKDILVEIKDDKGNVIRSEYIMEDEKKWDKAFDKLKNEHKEAVEEREKQLKDYVELLKTETSVDLYKIKLADVPEDITTMQLNSIISIITEE